MARLPETTRALDELAANRHFGMGEHRAHTIQAGVPGLHLGFETFDPRRHQPHQIDIMAPFADVLGEAQVPLVRPNRPLSVNVISDYSDAIQHPVVAQTKRRLAEDLSFSIGEALPGMTDRTRFYAISDDIPVDLDKDIETVPTSDAEALTREISGIARDGLTFVISGFHRLSLPDNRHGELVAVKVNHSLERQIPANIGVVSLHGLAEVDTKKPKKLAAVNDRLEQRHRVTVRSLESKGAVVASVVSAHSNTAQYDTQAADDEIAAALRSLI